MSNKFRNRMTIRLGGQNREIVANFSALSGIQSELGSGELETIRKFGVGKFGIREITSIIFNGLKGAGDNRLSRSEIGDLILESREYDEFAANCVEFLSMGLDTGETNEGKSKEETPSKSE